MLYFKKGPKLYLELLKPFVSDTLQGIKSRKIAETTLPNIYFDASQNV